MVIQLLFKYITINVGASASLLFPKHIPRDSCVRYLLCPVRRPGPRVEQRLRLLEAAAARLWQVKVEEGEAEGGEDGVEEESTTLAEDVDDGEEGHGDKQVAHPVDRGGQAGALCPRPQRVDLRVDCPGQRAHARREEEDVQADPDDGEKAQPVWARRLEQPARVLVRGGAGRTEWEQ